MSDSKIPTDPILIDGAWYFLTPAYRCGYRHATAKDPTAIKLCETHLRSPGLCPLHEELVRERCINDNLLKAIAVEESKSIDRAKVSMRKMLKKLNPNLSDSQIEDYVSSMGS